MTVNIVAFGSYDTRKPRVRLLLDALRRSGRLQEEIAITGWERVPETNIPSRASWLRVLVRMVASYPGALLRLLRTTRGSAILLPYPGIVEILLLGPLARLLGRPLLLDAFLPLHDTIVNDRGLLAHGPAERLLWHFEKACLRRADLIIVDTDCQGDYYAEEFGLPRERFITVLVGAEPQFSPDPPSGDDATDLLGPPDGAPIVLFYGQLIPLHGVETIIAAAQLARGSGARWVIIGRGQLENLLRARRIESLQPAIEWIEWVDYNRLPAVIVRATLCLGVFGRSAKAARVIPNKVFQQLACGKPVLTRHSPAVDELSQRFPRSVLTVAPGDAAALAEAVAAVLKGERQAEGIEPAALGELTPDHGLRRVLERVERTGLTRPRGQPEDQPR
jgi:glycosyltransferase involved in cell wall biosynthesis